MKNGNNFSVENSATERYLSPALWGCDDRIRPVPLFGVQALIHGQIWQALLDGKLQPGTKLPEGQIGSIFKVSRTVVRKVLIVMEQEQVVTLPQNRGAYVLSPEPKRISSVFEVMKLIACEIVRKLATQDVLGDEKNRKRVDLHREAQNAAIGRHDLTAIRRLGMEFLILLGDICGNKYYAETLDRTMSTVILAMMMDRKQFLEWPVQKLQEPILRHIETKHAEDAAVAMNQYLDVLESTILNDMRSHGDDLNSILSDGLDLRLLNGAGRGEFNRLS